MKALKKIFGKITGALSNIGWQPILCVAIAVVFLFAIFFGVNMCTNKNKSTNDTSASQATTENLTSEQAALVEKYNDDIRSVLETLKGQTWGIKQESAFIEFTDCSYTEIKSDERKTVTFAVAAVDISNVVIDGYSSLRYQLSCLGADNSYFFITLDSFLNSNNQANGDMAVTSENFKNSQTYGRLSAATQVSVSNFPEQALEYFGGDMDKITKVVSEYCSVNYPVVTEVSCSGKVTLDFSAGTAQTALTMNNANKTAITLTCNIDSGELSVAK